MTTGARVDAAADVAVVGMGLKVPGADSPEEFWTLLDKGAELFVEAPAQRWHAPDFVHADPNATDKTYQDRAGYIVSAHPDHAEDYCRTWLRHSVRQALDGVTRTNSDRVDLWLGHTADNSLHQDEASVRSSALADGLGEVAEHFARARQAGRYLPHRIVRDAVRGLLPEHHTTHVLDTACSSSLYALDLGVRRLRSGDTDLALCGGMSLVTPTNVVLFSKNRGLSRGGVVRALDAGADGTLFADAAAVLVLKRLDRAVTDGDTVHGVISGIGLSADGRGTAIYAPSETAQRRAIESALADADIAADEVAFVVAHATGTPAGDSVELRALRESYRHPITVVSNKSLIGHTGWAAGAVSVVHLALALRHGQIPPQYRFDAPPLDLGTITVPTTPRAWPASADGPARTGAVCGFGFGGTNAHLILREHRPGRGPRRACLVAPATARDREPVVVAWSSRLPPAGAATFGDHYPQPPLTQLRLPATTVRRMDRTQIMLVECVNALPDGVRGVCAAQRARVGVVIGHCGPTRNAQLYRSRVHLDQVRRAVTAIAPRSGPALAAHQERVRGLVPHATEDSFPGEMANIIAARLSNYFDLRGLSLTVDTGEASLIDAFAIGTRYLAEGVLDVVLVGAANGNTLPAWEELLSHESEPVRPREGAFLFAVTARKTAEENGLPVLAVVEPPTVAVPDDGATRPCSTYCGAEGGPELVSFLSGRAGKEAALLVRRAPDRGEPARTLRLSRDGARATPAVRRYAYTLGVPVCPPQNGDSPRADAQSPLPDPCVVLTNNLDVLTGTTLPDGVRVVDVGAELPFDPHRIDQALSGPQAHHLRILVDPATSPLRVARLLEAVYLAARGRNAGSGSFVVVVLGGVDSRRRPHPRTGAFTGLAAGLATDTTVAPRVVVHEATRFDEARADLERELRAGGPAPVTFHVSGERLVGVLEDRPVVTGPIPLTRDSVVVCAGGARGIGALAVTALAEAVAPRIFLIGSTRLDPQRPALPGKLTFLRARTSGPDAVSPKNALAEYERLLREDEAASTLAALREYCGADRVTYLTCDLRDSAAVHDTIRHVLDVAPSIDLLLNVAGISRPASLDNKTLAEFKAVRDTKLAAHANLSSALRDNRPRLWCNFGSATALAPVPGEADYCAANGFLLTAALSQRHLGEFSIAWGWWADSGLAADPITRSRLAEHFTPITTDEGVRAFLADLADTRRPEVIAYLGDAEIEQGTRYGSFAAQTAPARTRPPASFYVDGTERPDSEVVVVSRVLDLDRDGYLDGHRIDRYATMPGLFQVELAAEAALRLVPGRVATVFEDLDLVSFLRVYSADRPRPVRVTARLRSHDRYQSTVDVQVAGDVVGPQGIVVADKVYATVVVTLHDRLPEAPLWSGPDDPGTPEAEASRSHDSGWTLTGVFASLADLRRTPRGHRARLRLAKTELERWFTDVTTPMVTLDALAQLGVLSRAAAPDGTIPVPRHVRRIELYGPAKDVDLARVAGGIDLHCVCDNDRFDRDESVAVAPGGRVVARVIGLTSVRPGEG
ncbi:SDR family NAD(P)-dependent oxidoreductase [Amycolatopsis alba]|uniref:Uncharacterized protein n=1 Tax=Amycolatopsis alba DSM 44262 TaxID=1125972 RepID=A0A229RLP1_AMYAL|nr:SDR family NAD(P)-dependent oxidoreductase [Amycolatopsis alba]OXM47344.1 hypothetical protein CFP75_24200 [Amycolatopsis alba DSM 44262]